MTLAWSTGGEEERPCRLCGLSVVHQEIDHAPGKKHFHPKKHDAPCGLPCFASGVPGLVYKSGQFHRNNEYGKCPRCYPDPEAP